MNLYGVPWKYNPSPWPEPICFHLPRYQGMYTDSLGNSALVLGTVSEVFNGALSLLQYTLIQLLTLIHFLHFNTVNSFNVNFIDNKSVVHTRGWANLFYKRGPGGTCTWLSLGSK